MPRMPPPRYEVRVLNSAVLHWRRVLPGLAWGLGMIVVAALTWALARPPADLAARAARAEALRRDNAALKQQLAVLIRSRQIARIATDALRRSLADRDEEIAGLRTDLALYTRLTGASAQREGLTVQDLRVRPIHGARAYAVTVTLTQNARRGETSRGHVSLSVEGVRAGKAAQLAWSDLAPPPARAGLPFAFKYFQQVQGMLVLPAGLVPSRVIVSVQPDGGTLVSHSFAWTAALKSRE
jgi:hypothetical protein